jgi:hypothetical protein
VSDAISHGSSSDDTDVFHTSKIQAVKVVEVASKCNLDIDFAWLSRIFKHGLLHSGSFGQYLNITH